MVSTARVVDTPAEAFCTCRYPAPNRFGKHQFASMAIILTYVLMRLKITMLKKVVRATSSESLSFQHIFHIVDRVSRPCRPVSFAGILTPSLWYCFLSAFFKATILPLLWSAQSSFCGAKMASGYASIDTKANISHVKTVEKHESIEGHGSMEHSTLLRVSGGKHERNTTKPVTTWGLTLMFSLSFFPMLSVPLVLLLLVLAEKDNFSTVGTIDLPINDTALPSNYYTEVTPAKFALVSSCKLIFSSKLPWSMKLIQWLWGVSTAVRWVSSPFLLLFSFLIARFLVQQSTHESEYQVREVLHSCSYNKLIKWIPKLAGQNKRGPKPDKATIAAIIGLVVTLVNT